MEPSALRWETIAGPSAEMQLGMLARLLVAALLSAALGWERASAGKAAGLRTHMLVGVTSALYTTVGLLFIERWGTVAGMRSDPIRIVEAIATGVGFLGAGTIFFARRRGTVKGLTTAASIWSTAAVGVAAGSGYVIVAAGAAALVLVILHVLDRLEPAAMRAREADEDEEERPAGERTPAAAVSTTAPGAASDASGGAGRSSGR